MINSSCRASESIFPLTDLCYNSKCFTRTAENSNIKLIILEGAGNSWKSGNARFVDTYMIRQKETVMEESLRALLLRTFPMIGPVRFAA
jgi:hypothetical protein